MVRRRTRFNPKPRPDPDAPAKVPTQWNMFVTDHRAEVAVRFFSLETFGEMQIFISFTESLSKCHIYSNSEEVERDVAKYRSKCSISTENN